MLVENWNLKREFEKQGSGNKPTVEASWSHMWMSSVLRFQVGHVSRLHCLSAKRRSREEDSCSCRIFPPLELVLARNVGNVYGVDGYGH